MSDRKYNESIAAIFKSKSNSGNFVSLFMTEEMLKQLAKVAVGDRILVKFLTEDRRKNANSPNGYLEIQKFDENFVPEKQSNSEEV